MFDKGKNNYRSDLTLGEKYRDKTTGLEGHLVAIHFYEHACERATLRYVDSQRRVQEVSFDAPELIHVETGAVSRVTKTGGPTRTEGRRA
jgi:hypothetical protein